MSALQNMIDNMENNPEVRAAAERMRSAPPRETPVKPDLLGGVGSANPVCGICFCLLPWNNEFRAQHAEWHRNENTS